MQIWDRVNCSFSARGPRYPDFVARSRRDPSSELTDYGEWCRLWIDAFENPRGVVMHRGE